MKRERRGCGHDLSCALHSLIAHLVTRRRGAVWSAVALICALSAYVLVTRMKLDSEVLNLLPERVRIG